MAKKQVNVNANIPNSIPMEGRIIYDYQIRSLEGKLLGLLESLGLTEKQELAIKDILKDMFYRTMYFETEYIWGEFLNEAITKSKAKGVVGSGSQ